ncbi:hypothetical protein NBT05_01195 [Aquimarina sp. ERC-38]|nr:hypothetical protein [Aquimarina sp. ERC-38]UZO81107.1 hypothetical protein NBT05_01195 [Aquimarina sp. ERC-38]
MKSSSVFGLASFLFSKRKYKFALVGMQFAYLGYKMLKKKRAAKAVSHR